MLRLLLTYAAVFLGVYLLVSFFAKQKGKGSEVKVLPSRNRFRSKPEKGPWVQIYDTDSVEDAKGVLARLQEEEIECCLYEQGRKDVHGNPLKGFGIAVPRSAMPRGQTVISRMPV